MKLFILFVACAAAFLPLQRFDSNAPMSGTSYFLGSEDIFALSKGAKNMGIIVGSKIDWNFDATNQVLNWDLTSFYIAKNQAGPIHGTATFYYNNNTMVSSGSNGVTTSGFFNIRNHNEIDIVATGKGPNSQSFVISAKATAEAITEVVTVQVAGLTLNAYPKMSAVSSLVWDTIISQQSGTTSPAMHERDIKHGNIGQSLFAAIPLKPQ